MIRGATESLFGRVSGAVFAPALAVVLSGFLLDIPALPPGGFGALPLRAQHDRLRSSYVLHIPCMGARHSMHGSKADW